MFDCNSYNTGRKSHGTRNVWALAPSQFQQMKKTLFSQLSPGSWSSLGDTTPLMLSERGGVSSPVLAVHPPPRFQEKSQHGKAFYLSSRDDNNSNNNRNSNDERAHIPLTALFWVRLRLSLGMLWLGLPGVLTWAGPPGRAPRDISPTEAALLVLSPQQ